MTKQPWEMDEQELADFLKSLDEDIIDLKLKAEKARRLAAAKRWCDAIREGKVVDAEMKAKSALAQLRALGMRI